MRARTAELEAVNRELQAFSYSLAHDLRQPLISINGFAARLRNARPIEAGSRPDHYMGRIEAGVCQINNLAEAMTALARLSRARLERSSVDVSAIANAALAACQQREPDRVVNFQVQEGLQTTADTALLTVAVERLIDNAWKFTREQARAEIRFGCEPGSDGTVVFHVKDNGLGFNMEYAGQLFSAFQNMHTPDGFSGSGIGLASAHKIITRHGGRIWAESAPGQGASFYFTLG